MHFYFYRADMNMYVHKFWLLMKDEWFEKFEAY